MFLRTAIGAALLVLAAGAARAQTPDRYSLRGFGGVAFTELSSDGRWAESATKDGGISHYDFAVNLAAQPRNRFSLRAQGFAGHNLRGERFSLDYGFGEYAFSPTLRVRAGKVLTPFGLYSEIYDVGTLRPFYYLPQFYQGRLGLIPKSYLGAGATGLRSLGRDWEVNYDVFGGEMRFEEFTRAQLVGFDPATRLPIIEETDTRLVGSKMVGGRLLLATPARGFDVGASVLYIGKVERQTRAGRLPFDTGKDATFVNGRAQYQRGPLVARAEYFNVFTEKADVRSYYVEVSHRFAERWQIAAQYENSHLSLLPGDNSVPPPLREHESVGAALNFWLRPSVVIKLNGYHVEGNLLNRPKGAIVSYLQGTLDRRTNVAVLGAQFSF